AQARGENVPALNPGIQDYLDKISGIAQQLSNPSGLVDLDPATKAALQQITQNTLGQLNQRFTQDQGTLLANLYGNRINQSSIANTAVGQLLQNQGLVQSQALSDAAQRELQTRQYLTDEARQRLNAALSGYGEAAGNKLAAFGASTGAAQAQQNSLLALLS